MQMDIWAEAVPGRECSTCEGPKGRAHCCVEVLVVSSGLAVICGEE